MTAANRVSFGARLVLLPQTLPGDLAFPIPLRFGFCQEELVSIDFNHNPSSSTFDLTQTQIVDGRLVRVLAWYDNEWGFSNRMSDTAAAMGKLA